MPRCPWRTRAHAARRASTFFLLARVVTPNEFANARRSALFILRTSLAPMPAALAPGFSAILSDAGGVTSAWLELAEPGSTVSAL